MLTNRIFVKYVFTFRSSFMCIHVQKSPKTAYLLSNLEHIWWWAYVVAIQAHYEMVSRILDLGSVAPLSTFVFEQTTGLSHHSVTWVSPDEHFSAKRSGLLLNGKNPHQCMLRTEPGPIKTTMIVKIQEIRAAFTGSNLLVRLLKRIYQQSNNYIMLPL